MLKDLDDNWEAVAPQLLDYYYTIPKEEHAIVAREIRHQYFGNEPINTENLRNLIHLVGDRIFSADAAKAAMLQSRMSNAPVWFYYYSYEANNSLVYPVNDPNPNPHWGR